MYVHLFMFHVFMSLVFLRCYCLLFIFVIQGSEPVRHLVPDAVAVGTASRLGSTSVVLGPAPQLTDKNLMRSAMSSRKLSKPSADGAACLAREVEFVLDCLMMASLTTGPSCLSLLVILFVSVTG